MKNTIKLFVALAMVLGFAVNTMAQQSDNDVLVGRAQVSAQVNVTQLRDLVFGMVTPGVTKTISTTGSVLAGTAATAPSITQNSGAEQSGQFSVTKGLNTQVTLGFSLPTNLVNGGENLPINFTDAGANKLAKLGAFGGAQVDFPFTPGTGVIVSNANTPTYFADDDFYVFIGGTVVPVAAQVAGVYTGNIILTATYN